MTSSDKLSTDADRLVTLIVEKCLDGVFPLFPDQIVEAVLRAIPCVRDAGEAETQVLANALHVAILNHLDAQRVVETSEFVN
jgi:hypothetical protein